jgi:methionyl-tRNA synthetase
MIINTYSDLGLEAIHGIDMSSIDGTGVGAGWGRVQPGRCSEPQQHDEVETFVIVRGTGHLIADGKPHPVAPGAVVTMEPFETHQLMNSGEQDLVFATFYWRQPERAVRAAQQPVMRRFGERPVFVFSTPPTPNGDLHLGHLGGPYLGADVFVRFQRMNGVRAWHLTGTDDYQAWVVGCARREGRTPAQTAAYYHAEIAATLRLMDIEPDQYTAPSQDANYHVGLQQFFARLVKSGRAGPVPGPALFDGVTGDYLYEADLSGGCPTCAAGTYGYVCEECGVPNLCVDLAEPRSQRSEAPVRSAVITRLSLPLHEFRADVTAHHSLGRVPARLKHLAELAFQRGQFDMPLSHPSAWGVPPADSGTDGQVIWSYPEMAYGFLHGIGELGRRQGEDWSPDAPGPDWKIVHFFGYDNSFYHSIMYPVLYRLAFPGWTPDIDYHVNEFYLLEEQKFSTSRRHAIWGKEILGPDSVDQVRFFLARIRPEGRRTNFRREDYEQVLTGILIGTWQDWLNDLGRRLEAGYGGVVPDAGLWTPEQTAFLARLAARLTAVTGSLGQDGFSLNQAADELAGLVTDARAFAAREGAVPGWPDEARTAIALELAAAKLLADCAAPVMPRFAGRLAGALGLPEPACWPETITLVPPGTRADLAGQVFFGQTATSPLLPWLEETVRAALELPADVALAGKSLAELGMTSMQAIAVQYLIAEKTGVDVSIEEMFGPAGLAVLAKLLDARTDGMVTM